MGFAVISIKHYPLLEIYTAADDIAGTVKSGAVFRFRAVVVVEKIAIVAVVCPGARARVIMARHLLVKSCGLGAKTDTDASSKRSRSAQVLNKTLYTKCFTYGVETEVLSFKISISK